MEGGLGAYTRLIAYIRLGLGFKKKEIGRFGHWPKQVVTG